MSLALLPSPPSRASSLAPVSSLSILHAIISRSLSGLPPLLFFFLFKTLCLKLLGLIPLPNDMQQHLFENYDFYAYE